MQPSRNWFRARACVAIFTIGSVRESLPASFECSPNNRAGVGRGNSRRPEKWRTQAQQDPGCYCRADDWRGRSSRVSSLASALGTARLELSANYTFAVLRRLWLRRCAQIRLHRLIAGKYLVGFLVGDGSGDDDVVALLPVRRGRNAMLRGQLDRI
jgi:phenylalanyl-tRNA synthetase beta subunit